MPQNPLKKINPISKIDGELQGNPIEELSMISVENNPRGNTPGGSALPFMEPFNDFTVNDANQKEQQQTYQQQGWVPMRARRQERLRRLALFDAPNSTPNADGQANGIGVPTESMGGNFKREDINKSADDSDSLLEQRKKRFPKLTRQPDGHTAPEDMIL